MKRRAASKKVVKRRKQQKKKMTLSQMVDYWRKTAASERGWVAADIRQISIRIERIEAAQRAIERDINAIITDYIRHPLKIDGMSQAAFRDLVDRAARDDPRSFDPVFTALKETSDDG